MGRDQMAEKVSRKLLPAAFGSLLPWNDMIKHKWPFRGARQEAVRTEDNSTTSPDVRADKTDDYGMVSLYGN